MRFAIWDTGLASTNRTDNRHCKGTRQQVVAAGAIAGLVSRFCIAPLDVVKIRLQLQTHPPRNLIPGQNHVGPIYRGTFPTFQAILREEGITAFWKGNIPAELLYILYGSLQFSIYRSTTLAIHALPPSLHPPTYIESFISGALAGAAATSLTYPLDLLRTRFAAQGKQKVYQSLLGGIRAIYRHEGPTGFFQGVGAGVGQVVPYMGLFFSTYEALRAPLSTLSLPFGSGDATAGVLASITAKTGTFPLDLIRKRLQVQGPTRGSYVNGGYMEVYERGVWDTGRRIVAREGWRGLYRGLGVGLVKAAPASAVTMWTYERALRELKRWEVLD